jgi:hypothetical protein
MRPWIAAVGRLCLLAAPAACLADAGRVAAGEVTIMRDGPKWALLRDGRPFFIKGAVLGGDPWGPESLARAGGNAVRAGTRSLGEAQQRGLAVLVNLPLGLPRRGFDYADPAAVARQLDATRQRVRATKGHPAVLMWALGNELEIQTNRAQREPVWKAINALARMIHQEDGRHPVITVIGGQYREVLHEAQGLCPDLDAVGLNAYADMLTLPEDVTREGWDRPYVVTEFGPRGHWQAPRTPWRVPVEQTSTEKADYYRKAYEHAVAGRATCLGSFVFYWSRKHEKTPTWYGLFLADGRRTGAVDVMQELWTGRPPANRCPAITGGRDAIRLEAADRPSRDPSDVVAPGTLLRCSVTASDPEGDAVRVTWELHPDRSNDPRVGGDYEPPTQPIAGAVVESKGTRAVVRVPDEVDRYRLYLVVDDGHGGVATANRPVNVVR